MLHALLESSVLTGSILPGGQRSCFSENLGDDLYAGLVQPPWLCNALVTTLG